MLKKDKGFSLVELMAVCAIIGILTAIAIPYYVAYKRSTCDRVAQEDLANIAAAWEKYINDDSNVNHKAPQDLKDLAGEFYGWGGTSTKCDVRFYLDHSTLTVYSASYKGSHPRGTGTRYMFMMKMPAGLSPTSAKRDDGPGLFWSVLGSVGSLLEPSSAYAKSDKSSSKSSSNSSSNSSSAADTQSQTQTQAQTQTQSGNQGNTDSNHQDANTSGNQQGQGNANGNAWGQGQNNGNNGNSGNSGDSGSSGQSDTSSANDSSGSTGGSASSGDTGSSSGSTQASDTGGSSSGSSSADTSTSGGSSSGSSGSDTGTASSGGDTSGGTSGSSGSGTTPVADGAAASGASPLGIVATTDLDSAWKAYPFGVGPAETVFDKDGNYVEK